MIIRETDKEPGPEPTSARCEDCLVRVGMAQMVNKLESAVEEMTRSERELYEAEYETDERLARLARITAYAEELVEDDYLWFDSSATYCREKIRALLHLIGAKSS